MNGYKQIIYSTVSLIDKSFGYLTMWVADVAEIFLGTLFWNEKEIRDLGKSPGCYLLVSTQTSPLFITPI
jgi:hypothetical protein